MILIRRSPGSIPTSLAMLSGRTPAIIFLSSAFTRRLPWGIWCQKPGNAPGHTLLSRKRRPLVKKKSSWHHGCDILYRAAYRGPRWVYGCVFFIRHTTKKAPGRGLLNQRLSILFFLFAKFTEFPAEKSFQLLPAFMAPHAEQEVRSHRRRHDDQHPYQAFPSAAAVRPEGLLFHRG